MATTTFDAKAYDMDDFDIAIKRKRGRVSFDCYPLQCFGFDCRADDFVAWCQANGVKLYTKVVGILYQPEFRDDEAKELFRRTWMTQGNLMPESSLFERAAAAPVGAV